jgi:acyl carrier protein/NAD(P)-dependent dehydrogenase (short-subunit alcohol dehydrogenase family)
MQTQFPELPKLDTNLLAELRTLGQIVDQMGSAVVVESAPAVVEAPASSEEIAPAPASAQASGLRVEVVSAALLSIVSEKTGYPVETLELDMDMEADLGIDSIKRVEILGAMQTQFPGLPKLESTELAELRTLGQIIDMMSAASQEAVPPSKEVTAESPFDEPVFEVGVDQGVVIRRLLPPPDYLEFDLPAGHVCLVTDDGTLVTAALAQSLLDKGWPVVVIRFPVEIVPQRIPLPEGVASVELSEMSETALQQCLSEVAAQHGQVAVFLHMALPGQNAAAGGVDFPQIEKAMLKLVFLAAKHLKTSLVSAAGLGRAAFMTVTRLDGEFGLGEEADYTPVNGGLFGLVKTLNLEWDSVFCRAVDLSPALEPDRMVEYIQAELHDPNRLVIEVGYNLSERSTLTLLPLSLPVTGVKK